jgi:hypothetical protein
LRLCRFDLRKRLRLSVSGAPLGGTAAQRLGLKLYSVSIRQSQQVVYEVEARQSKKAAQVRESEPFGEAQPLDTSKRQSRTDKARLLVNIESHFQSHPFSKADFIRQKSHCRWVQKETSVDFSRRLRIRAFHRLSRV